MLLEKTFPQIKLFCQARGYEFQVVDMRWGVRDESTDDHMGTELCLKELIQCRDISTGPIFVVQLFINYYMYQWGFFCFDFVLVFLIFYPFKLKCLVCSFVKVTFVYIFLIYKLVVWF